MKFFEIGGFDISITTAEAGFIQMPLDQSL
jgi:hypothetical protein